MDPHYIETRKFEWKFHNFTEKLLITEKLLWSDGFIIFLDVFKTKWHFCIELKAGKFSVILYCKNAETEADNFTVKSEVTVRNLNKDKKFDFHCLRTSNEFKAKKSYFITGAISINHICQNAHLFLKDNTLTLDIKVELTKKKEVADPQANNEYQKMCIDYFKTKSYSDFKLACSDGVKIPVHRFVLAGISTVMKEIFDTKTTKSKVINIYDIDGETMTEILRFIYTREVQNVDKLAEKLLYGADKYELDNLKKHCVSSMIKNLSVQNAVDYFILADQYDIKVLKDRSTMFIKSHHKEISKNEKNLNKLTKELLIMLLDHYHQNPGDVQVLESTL